ncbi:MAG: hypothetical protein JW925_13795 [Syntrophaceae bacterium]|nr:hypothetical protein [Syntrophaceae bacterium]
MNDQGIIKIKPQKQSIIVLLILLFLIPIAAIYRFYKEEWIRFGFYSLVWLVIIADVVIRRLFYKIRGKNIYDNLTLKLTSQGFYKGDNLFKWSDIDHFGIKKEYITLFSPFFDHRVVYWNYKPSFKNKHWHFLQTYDYALSTKYEMEPDILICLLNDWKTRYSGQYSEIKIGRGLKNSLKGIIKT